MPQAEDLAALLVQKQSGTERPNGVIYVGSPTSDALASAWLTLQCGMTNSLIGSRLDFKQQSLSRSQL